MLDFLPPEVVATVLEDREHERLPPVLLRHASGPEDVEAEAEGLVLAPTLAEVELLNGQGWYVRDHALPPAVVARARAEAEELSASGRLRTGGLGRAEVRWAEVQARSDDILWLDEAHPPPAIGTLLHALQRLRRRLVAAHGLGEAASEVQLARYREGGRYVRHLDAYRGAATRRLTVLLYLNPDWTEAQGGCLRLYPDRPQAPPLPHLDVAPLGGRLLVFQSRRLEHEVRPVAPLAPPRYSLTCWYY